VPTATLAAQTPSRGRWPLIKTAFLPSLVWYIVVGLLQDGRVPRTPVPGRFKGGMVPLGRHLYGVSCGLCLLCFQSGLGADPDKKNSHAAHLKYGHYFCCDCVFVPLLTESAQLFTVIVFVTDRPFSATPCNFSVPGDTLARKFESAKLPGQFLKQGGVGGPGAIFCRAPESWPDS